jgi:hypothetical protein
MNTQDESRLQRLKATNDEAFNRWLAEPLTRMGLSMVPAGDKDDTLRLLLRSAFDAGVGCGQGGFAVEMLTSMMNKEQK